MIKYIAKIIPLNKNNSKNTDWYKCIITLNDIRLVHVSLKIHKDEVFNKADSMINKIMYQCVYSTIYKKIL